MKTIKRTLSVLLAVLIAFAGFTFAFAADPEATALTIGTKTEGALANADEVDSYSVTFTAAGFAKVKFNTVGTGNNRAYYSVSVVDSAKKEVISFKANGNESEVVSPDFNVAAGTYYINVSMGLVWAPDNYGVTVLSVTPDTAKTETESNNTPATATALTDFDNNGFSATFFGAIDKNDVDYYSVSTKQGYFSVYLDKTDGKRGSFNVQVLAVVGTTEYVIASFDYNDTESARLYSSEIGCLADKYYIKVTGLNGSCGSYKVGACVVADLQSEAEYNNIESKANELADKTFFYAALNSTDDIDIFKVDSKKERYSKATSNLCDTLNVTIAASGANTTGEWNVAVYKEKGAKVFEDRVTVSHSVVIKFNDYDAGVYYIKVTKGSNYDDYNYTVKAEQVTNEVKLSTLEQIKALFSSEGMKNFTAQIKELFSNIDWIYTLVNLFKTSIVPIIRWIQEAD